MAGRRHFKSAFPAKAKRRPSVRRMRTVRTGCRRGGWGYAEGGGGGGVPEAPGQRRPVCVCVCVCPTTFSSRAAPPRVPFLPGAGAFRAVTQHPPAFVHGPRPPTAVWTCRLFMRLHARYVRSALCNGQAPMSRARAAPALRELAKVPSGAASAHSCPDVPPSQLCLPTCHPPHTPATPQPEPSEAWPKAGASVLPQTVVLWDPEERWGEGTAEEPTGCEARAGGLLGGVPQEQMPKQDSRTVYVEVTPDTPGGRGVGSSQLSSGAWGDTARGCLP